MAVRKLNLEGKQHVHLMYNNGCTVKDISLKNGVSKQQFIES